jgi:putative pyrroloquinoline-quinone binding quinoprotein
MRRGGLLALILTLVGPGAAQAADETTQELVNAAHTSSVPDSPLQPPLRLRWQANLGHVRSNVVVSGGRAFYVRQPGTGAQLTALSTADGSVLWSQDGAGVAGLALDGGKLFVIRAEGEWGEANTQVRALDPSNGSTLWERTVSSEYGPASEITAADGQLYYLAGGGTATLYAMRQSDGADRWPPKPLASGTYSTPALDADSVYVSMAGDQTHAFRRADGVQRWHYDSGISGGGGISPVVHDGLLYGDDGNLHRTSDGLIVGSWSTRPAWSGDVGVTGTEVVSSAGSEGVRGIGPGYGDTRWTTPLEDTSSWLIAGQHAYVGTGFYGADVHAVRLSDGAEVWCGRPEMPQGSWTGSSSDEEVHPVAAGDGLLLVEAGYGLAAYESGGSGSTCASRTTSPPSSGGGSTSPPAPWTSRPALTVDVERTALLLGERTSVQGQVVGMPITAGQEVVAQLDVWPFEGAYVDAGRDRASDGGFVGYTLEPERNVRVRLRLASDPGVVSAEQTVWADFPITIERLGAGGRRPRVRSTVYAYPGAQIRRKVVHGYLLRPRWSAFRRVASHRFQRLARRSASVTLRYPRGTLGRRDRVLICTREREPDAFGEPSPYDAACGARTLPRSAG